MRSDGPQPLVELRGVGKDYRLFDRPWRRLAHLLTGSERGLRRFEALHRVDLELHAGQTLGIIGRNGAGKSTLLQIIAGVLPASSGEVVVRGKVAALLELGSGFNPEYTGRENVFMNGAILGISRRQMAQRFEQIADFADIGSFMDQPVKTYSSGMFVRLAFAVSTTVEADILLIDEALAVGDVFFRQKCYRRLEEIRARGTAIVLVSHATTEVEQFCGRAILLEKGHVAFSGPATEAVKRYYLLEQQGRLPAAPESGQVRPSPTAVSAAPAAAVSWPGEDCRIDLSAAAQVSDGSARCTGLWVTDGAGQARGVFEQGQRLVVWTEFALLRPVEAPFVGLVMQNQKGVTVHGKSSLELGSAAPLRLAAGSRLRARQEVQLNLENGEYTFEVGLGELTLADYAQAGTMPYQMLSARWRRLCHVPLAGRFAVAWRSQWSPVQLTHHGIADLPGRCDLSLVAAGAASTSG